MLVHLVEIFIKDPLRVVPETLRGLVSSLDICMETFSSLHNVLRVQMPQNVDPEDGLIYNLLHKSENLAQAAGTAKVLAGKLGRSVDEMKSRGLTVELRHVHALDGCLQDVKALTECYRRVSTTLVYVNRRSFRKYRKYNCILLPSTLGLCNPVLTSCLRNTKNLVRI